MIKSSTFVGLGLLFLIIFGRHDLPLMMIGFAFVQLAMGPISLFLILLRIANLLKNKKAWVYYFSGIIQTGFCIIDIILILLNHTVIKSGMMIFLALNSVLAGIVFLDIYKPTYAKGNLAGDPGSQTTYHQNNRTGDRKNGNVEQRSEALPENVG
jgi:hypothetical protein